MWGDSDVIILPKNILRYLILGERNSRQILRHTTSVCLIVPRNSFHAGNASQCSVWLPQQSILLPSQSEKKRRDQIMILLFNISQISGKYKTVQFHQIILWGKLCGKMPMGYNKILFKFSFACVFSICLVRTNNLLSETTPPQRSYK